MAYRYVLYIALTLFVFLVPRSVLSQPAFVTKDVVIGLDNPCDILWGPDNRIWATERDGIDRIDPETGEMKRLVTFADANRVGVSGMLGLAIHPDFPDSPYVYVTYANSNSQDWPSIRLARLRYVGDTLIDRKILLDSLPDGSVHLSSRLFITPDRKLLLTTGEDFFSLILAQSHLSLAGKVLRLNLDGSVPADNPWASAPYPSSLIWATGLRNTPGLTMASNGLIYTSDNLESEINIIQRGRNYGWPIVQGYCDDTLDTRPDTNERRLCRDSNVVEPIRISKPWVVYAGLDYYNHERFPAWKNSLLLVTEREKDVRLLKLSGDGRSIISETVLVDYAYGRLFDICVSPGGRIFFSTSGEDTQFPRSKKGRIVEIIPSALAATITMAPLNYDSLYMRDTLTLTFTTSGSFSPWNVFSAQLSDNSGSFVHLQTLGTVKGTAGTSIRVALSCLDEVPQPNRYRLRIGASSPLIASNDNGKDLPFVRRAAPPITITHPEPASMCPYDSLVLEASPGFDYYTWSNGSTTRQTIAYTPGTYTVKGWRIDRCDPATDTVRLAELPGLDILTITQQGNLLIASEAATYQWLRRGGEGWQRIDGATSRSYMVTGSGEYLVTGRNEYGCGSYSEPLSVEVSDVADKNSSSGEPQIDWLTASDRLVVHLQLAIPGQVEIRVIDMAGKQVVVSGEEDARGSYRKELDLASLPAGAYLVEVRVGGKEWVRKIVRE